MQLPEQLRKQVEQANQHYRELENPESAAPAEAAQQPATEPGQEAQAEQQGAQPADTESTLTPQQPEQDIAYWQNRFVILQGKYNAEVPALSVRIRELEAELEKARKAADQSQQEAPKPQQALDALSQLTDEQLGEFGPEMLAMVETLIQRRTSHLSQAPQAQPDPELASKLERLEQAENQRQQERQQDAEARFWTTLRSRVKGLEQVNGDPAFHNWLSKYDPLSGVQRQQALVHAQQAWDAERVVAIFNAYLQETGQEPTKKREVPADQVQPAQSRSTTAPPAEAKVWTGPEITQFYNDKARGRYSREEADRIEADIFAATTSGRVR